MLGEEQWVWWGYRLTINEAQSQTQEDLVIAYLLSIGSDLEHMKPELVIYLWNIKEHNQDDA